MVNINMPRRKSKNHSFHSPLSLTLEVLESLMAVKVHHECLIDYLSALPLAFKLSSLLAICYHCS